MVEHAATAKRDQRDLDAPRQESIPGLAGVVNAVERKADKGRRLRFVRHDIIAERIDRVRKRFCRRRIEHRRHPGGAGDFQRPLRCRCRLLQLGDEDRRLLDGVACRLDIVDADGAGRARIDDDGIVAIGIVDEDESGARRHVVHLHEFRRHAGLGIGLQRHVAKGVAADLGDERHLAAGTRRGNGLVRSLATRADGEAAAGDRLADCRQAFRQIGRIGHENTENGNPRLHHSLPVTPIPAGRRPW